MKKLLFLSIMLMAGTLCFGQGKDYVTWEESGCDMDNYVITNFESNQDRYIGQKLSKLLDDIEPSIKSASKLRGKSITRDSIYFTGIDLLIMEPSHREQVSDNDGPKIDRKPTKTYYILIDTEWIYVENDNEEIRRKASSFLVRKYFPDELGEAVITKISHPWKKDRGD